MRKIGVLACGPVGADDTGNMTGPRLALEHDWHRARITARRGSVTLPPLVVAGVNVDWEADHTEVASTGMAVIFGMFPQGFAELRDLARQRLHLRREQAQPLTGVLDARLFAIWAWLPTLNADCYMEYDHAADEARTWLISEAGPREFDPDSPPAELDPAFLAAWVLNGNAHWGGEDGLERACERFGHVPLLIAARVAEALERHPKEPQQALELAQLAWPRLNLDDELPWAELLDQAHPWAIAQLGRVALRLGLLRAARALLSDHEAARLVNVAHFDHGQACEALDDIVGAGDAFAHFADLHPLDADGWRRLLFCRIRCDAPGLADTALARHRTAKGDDPALVARLSLLLNRSRISAEQRAWLAGWFAGRLSPVLAVRLPIQTLAEHWGRRHGEVSRRHLLEAIDGAREELSDLPPDEAEAGLYAVLLALPILGAPLPSDGRMGADAWAEIGLEAFNRCRERHRGSQARLNEPPLWMTALAAEIMHRG